MPQLKKVCFHGKNGRFAGKRVQFQAKHTRQKPEHPSACRYRAATNTRNYGISGRSRAS